MARRRQIDHCDAFWHELAPGVEEKEIGLSLTIEIVLVEPGATCFKMSILMVSTSTGIPLRSSTVNFKVYSSFPGSALSVTGGRTSRAHPIGTGTVLKLSVFRTCDVMRGPGNGFCLPMLNTSRPLICRLCSWSMTKSKTYYHDVSNCSRALCWGVRAHQSVLIILVPINSCTW
jgi:hypothetical protein